MGKGGGAKREGWGQVRFYPYNMSGGATGFGHAERGGGTKRFD